VPGTPDESREGLELLLVTLQDLVKQNSALVVQASTIALDHSCVPA